MKTLLFVAFLWIPGIVQAQAQTGSIAGRVLDVDGTPTFGVAMNVVAVKDPNELTGGTFSVVISSIQTDRDGRYLIQSVPVGRYYVQAGLTGNATYYPGVPSESSATVVTVTPGAVLERFDFKLARPGAFKVSGRVVRPAGAQPGSLSYPTTVLVDPLYSYLPGRDSLQAKIAQDGTFEFPKVASGSYRARLDNAPAGWNPVTFVVSDRDLSSLDFVAPILSEVTTRITVEGNGPVPRPTIVFSGSNGGQAYSGTPSILTNGPMKTILSAGEYRIVLSGLSSEFKVNSITSGSTDLLKDSLKIADVNPTEIVVTLGLTQGRWFAVRGRVLRPQELFDRKVDTVSLYAPGQTFGLSASVAADGSFEFPRVPQGSYLTRMSALLEYRPTSITVADRDLENVAIVLPRQVEIRGRISVEGGGPYIEPRLIMRGPSGNLQLSATRDGIFNRTSLPEGEYRFLVEGLPEGYYVKSATYGTTDLLKDPLKLGEAGNPEIQTILATRSPGQWRSVSGRVTGIPATDFGVHNVTLDGNPRPSIYSPVRPDGTFEFPEVLPGKYSVHTDSGRRLPPFTIDVAARNISGLEIEFHPRVHLRGRITVEDGGPVPEIGISYSGPTVTSAAVSTNASSDGRFAIQLPEGQLQISIFNGIPRGYVLKSMTYGTTDLLMDPAEVSRNDPKEIVVTLGASPSIPWKKVSGRVSIATGSEARPREVILSGPVWIVRPILPDRTFEFDKVPPGKYSVSANPSLSGPVTNTIVVGDKDIRDVEVSVPLQFEIRGRMIIESGLPPSKDTEIVLEARLSGGQPHSVAILEPSFRLPVLAGELRLSVRNPSARYRVVSITYGSTNLLNDPLSLNGPPASEIVVTLRTEVPNPSPVGATVSGTLTGMLSEVATPRRIVLCAVERLFCDEVIANDDGPFEFRGVPSGTYHIRVVGTLYTASRSSSIEVRDRDVNGVSIRILHSIAVPVTVALDDGSPLQDWPMLELESSGPIGPVVSRVPTSGSFTFQFGEGEQFLLPKNLPAGYYVKSMLYGGNDVMQFPLTIAKDDAPSTLRITLGRRN